MKVNDKRVKNTTTFEEDDYVVPVEANLVLV